VSPDHPHSESSGPTILHYVPKSFYAVSTQRRGTCDSSLASTCYRGLVRIRIGPSRVRPLNSPLGGRLNFFARSYVL